MDEAEMESVGREETGHEEESRPACRKTHHLPSVAEQLRHRLTHVPYRSWCSECVAGRKPNPGHRAIDHKREVGATPEIHMDYCFMRNEPNGESTPVLVLKDRDSKAIAAHVIPHKGGDLDWGVQQTVRDIIKWGVHGDIIMKTDQEPALKDFVREVAKMRSDKRLGRTVPENSPVKESQSNGLIEVGVKTVEGLVRTFKLALEKRTGRVLAISSPVFAWLVEHAADVATKYLKGEDGLSAYQRLKAKECRGELLEFGCRVQHRIPGKPQGGLMTPRWVDGIWLGKRFTSDEHIVSLPDGRVVRTRAVQSFPEATKWDLTALNTVVGLPWAPSGTLSHPTFTVPKADERMVEPDVVVQVIPRGITIRERHLEKFGYTETCRKCLGLQGKATTYGTLGHSKRCRERLIKEISADPVMKAEADAAEERKMRHLEIEVENEESGTKRRKGEADVSESSAGKEPANADPSAPMNESVVATVPVEAPLTGGASSSGTVRDGGGQPVLEQLPMSDGEGDATLPDASGMHDGGEKRAREDDSEELDRPVAFRTMPPEDDAFLSANLLASVGPGEPYLVCDVFSRPRTTARATERGYNGGWSMDLHYDDKITQRQWDLSEDADVRRAKCRLRSDRPTLLIVSPPCTLFSTLQNFNGPSSEKEYEKAVKMFVVGIELCELQNRLGGAFVLEHPQTSKAWSLPRAKHLLGQVWCQRVTLHMCAYGMRSTDAHGDGLVYKPTSLATNSQTVADMVVRRCTGGHRHVHLMAGRARAASAYPVALCDKFIDAALTLRKYQREVQLFAVGAKSLSDDAREDLCDMCCPCDNVLEPLMYFDSRTGETLDEQCVLKARQDELQVFNEMQVFRYATEQDVQATPGAKVIGTTWVDANKGTAEAPNFRSRLCAQEFAKGELRDDLFAATPPLLGVKLLASLCASERGKRLMVLDVKRAFLYGATTRPIFARLPPEDPRYGTPGLVWRLQKAMYGTRDAPAIWQKEVRRTMGALQFRCSKYNSCVHAHIERDILVNVHVDDFLCLASRTNLEWFYQQLSKEYLLKRDVLGPGEDEVREIEFLGRQLRWCAGGLEYEADRKHVQVLLREWDMTNCSGVVSPGVKETPGVPEPVLPDSAVSGFRRAVARLNYLSQDRPDISFATKELARVMSCPQPCHVVALKRVLRFLRAHPRGHQVYRWQAPQTELVAYVDSDWAGCLRTRRSTSGGLLMHGAHCLAHWSRTQSNVALSSGEAELNGALKGGVELLGGRSLLADMSRSVSLRLKGDSAACKGTLLREGAGKLKHVQVKQLWRGKVRG